MEKVEVIITLPLDGTVRDIRELIVEELTAQIEKESGADTFEYCTMKFGTIEELQRPSAPVNEKNYLVEVEFVQKEDNVNELMRCHERLQIGL